MAYIWKQLTRKP